MVIIKGANAKNMTIIGVINRIAITACSKTVFLILTISSEIADNLGK